MVTLYDGRKLSATVHSWDTRTDIAVLQVRSRLPRTTVEEEAEAACG